MFDILDPHAHRGLVYRALVRRPRSSVSGLIEQTGLTSAEVHTALCELEDSDVVTRIERDRWDAVSPEEVGSALLRLDEQRRIRLREAADELTRIYWGVRDQRAHHPALEILPDDSTPHTRYRSILAGAEYQVRSIDRPPYQVNGQELKQRLLSTGVRYRTIYHDAARSDAEHGADLVRTVRAGEQARTIDKPPMKLIIADDQCALLLIDEATTTGDGSLVVHSCGLLTALIDTFEAFWRLAMPVSTQGDPEHLDGRDAEIITLMASGATDTAIARQLGLSRRTVVRRTANLLDRLGATTRFQAGVQASRRGWF